ncbi:MAG: Transcription initiation factor IIA small chain (TFIIA 13.5 kDa subunit) [Gomphillus americanus]|uniref:Transcription initiation factor IIA subunit 2 n=1 Tax=Gomphillus americanus TaxID=1940652 RepID=A0A8H3EAS8_9LECA|nr:MAG: Transcription initiation factor IIA small chain (TFIIA 13.5 kDa subunit) [Gomphillus americanus]
MATEHYYEIYRRASIGTTLVDTLDELVEEGRIEPQLAMRVVSRFDRAIAEALAEKAKGRLNFKGHLDVYRFCDEVWTFMIKDVNLKLDSGQTIQAEKVKIVACNVKKPGEV